MILYELGKEAVIEKIQFLFQLSGKYSLGCDNENVVKKQSSVVWWEIFGIGNILFVILTKLQRTYS